MTVGRRQADALYPAHRAHWLMWRVQQAMPKTAALAVARFDTVRMQLLKVADVLTPDELAGALVAIADTRDAGRKEAWARRGQAFFQRGTRRSERAAAANAPSASPPDLAVQPEPGGHGAA